MALYVWYDGKNLAENFGITKNILRTDEDIEELDNDIEMNETAERLPLESVDIENDDLTEDMQRLRQIIKETQQTHTMKEFEDAEYEREQEAFNQYLLLNKNAREAYEKKYNIQSTENANGISYVKIPDNLFGNVWDDNDEDYEKQEKEKRNGNLFDMFMNL